MKTRLARERKLIMVSRWRKRKKKRLITSSSFERRFKN